MIYKIEEWIRKGGRATLLATPLLFASLVSQAATTSSNNEAEGFQCPDFPEATISLSYGSRYKDDSKSRSELDKEANAAVNKALGPSDKFIQILARLADKAQKKTSQREDIVRCAIGAIHHWAEADSFSEIDSLTANLSYASRVGGIAIAYAQFKALIPQEQEEPTDEVTSVGQLQLLEETDPQDTEEETKKASAEASDDLNESESQAKKNTVQLPEEYREDTKTIEHWLAGLGDSIIHFWETDGPPMASKNNLRAWAALAIIQIGLTVENEDFIEWGLESHRVILDTIEPDGSLPMEMRRGRYALHYQLHAVAPMVTATAMLQEADKRNSQIYMDRLMMAAKFSLRAIEKPELVEEKTDKPQTVKSGLLEQKKYQIAWLEPLLALEENPQLDATINDLRPLRNSKLGGNMTFRFHDSKNDKQDFGENDQ
ncbi:alginate lyase family protein [Cohaesibacter marisflavi]|uniref:alginate lyase family protein n=1 Tax=Cohaesibacter marisflavi TaxID=655353 RepID=UPI000B80229B|nr:alginate lyase family protein [Cohaesibacter marisflavi]